MIFNIRFIELSVVDYVRYCSHTTCISTTPKFNFKFQQFRYSIKYQPGWRRREGRVLHFVNWPIIQYCRVVQLTPFFLDSIDRLVVIATCDLTSSYYNIRCDQLFIIIIIWQNKYINVFWYPYIIILQLTFWFKKCIYNIHM